MEKKKVLIIDDEEDFVSVLKVGIEAGGHYDVITAPDGRTGIELAQKEKPDIILLDILMPVMSGYAVIVELNMIEQTKNIPVIALTAKSGMQELLKIEGVADYVIKPFDRQDLLIRIKRALQHKK